MSKVKPSNRLNVNTSEPVRLSALPVKIKSFTPPAEFDKSKSKFALVSVMPPIVPRDKVPATPKFPLVPVVLIPAAIRLALVTVSKPVEMPVPESVVVVPPLRFTTPVPVAEVAGALVMLNLPALIVVAPV